VTYRQADGEPVEGAMNGGRARGGLALHPLTYVRMMRGWSLQDLVNVISRAAREMGVNMAAGREKAWRWENRKVTPDEITQIALAHALGVPPERVTELPWPYWLPAGDDIRTAFAWSQTGTIEVLEDVLEHGMRDRRGFMKLTGSALVSLAHEWLGAEPAELTAVLRGGRVTEAFVDRLEDGLPRLRYMEAERGGLRTRELIDAELGMVAEVLANASYSTPIEQRLHTLAAELGRMAGWAAFDAGLHAAAQRYWTAALHAAHTAGDTVLGANVLKSMSLQCYDFSHPADALALARVAYEGAGETTPRGRAMFALREARAHAALGDHAACERLLGEADRALSQTDASDEDPTWLGYFDDAEAYAQIGTCYLDLGRYAQADSYLTKTLNLLPQTKIRDRATYLTRRASAQTRLGNVDLACQLMTDTVPLIHTAYSRRNTQRLFRVRERLPLRQRDPRVRELDDHLAELASAA
jgi:tetratricopeptide (TPR) repeat protein/transcriptional regulator with XRE-family HTH domain